MDLSQLTLAALRAMDPQARQRTFENLVRATTRPLSKTAFAVLHDRPLSEDVCQDAWGLLWRRLHAFLDGALLNGNPGPAGPIVPWLHAVVRNKALKVSKGRRRRSEVALDTVPGLAEDRESQSAPSGLGLDIETAIAELPPRQREVFTLRCQEMVPFEAIGHTLGISQESVRNALFGARKRLQALLKGWSG
jgi:RNA polymerase sigma-70 factor (ECF subfamily)